MLFNSYIFVLFFLPMCIAGYFVLNHFNCLLGQVFILGMSLWFYAYFNVRYLWIILESIVVNYTVYRLLARISHSIARKLLLAVALIFDFGTLAYYKYFDFFFENINALFQSNFTLHHLVLPLGISFFTFQQISFVIDAYKSEVPEYNFLYYASFVTYFPQLIAGPIVTHDELIPQFYDLNKKHINWDSFARGLYIFVLGLSKKILLADIWGNLANWGYSNIDSLSSPTAILVALSYTFQIYFDFSGYCDMALGIGYMMNIDLPLNFDSPYKSLSILDFWNRWHMTLTRFLTRYVYIPLGGNRHGKARTYLNVMVVFLSSGLWHGANWTFVLWGALHGVFSVIIRNWKKFFEDLHPALNWFLTFAFINIAWVFFRSDSIREAIHLLKRMASFTNFSIDKKIFDPFNIYELRLPLSMLPGRLSALSSAPYIFLAYFVLSFILILGPQNTCRSVKTVRLTLSKMFFLSILLIWCVFSFSSISTFLYFNF